MRNCKDCIENTNCECDIVINASCYKELRKMISSFIEINERLEAGNLTNSQALENFIMQADFAYDRTMLLPEIIDK